MALSLSLCPQFWVECCASGILRHRPGGPSDAPSRACGGSGNHGEVRCPRCSSTRPACLPRKMRRDFDWCRVPSRRCWRRRVGAESHTARLVPPNLVRLWWLIKNMPSREARSPKKTINYYVVTHVYFHKTKKKHFPCPTPGGPARCLVYTLGPPAVPSLG